MTSAGFEELVAASSGRVVIDLGTGDGLFPYRCARQSPDKLYIGIDSNIRALKKISEKIYRKPAKGGAPNVLYLQASGEALPDELRGIAEEIFVLYPWGSLLRAVLAPEENLLRSLRSICREGAQLRIVIGIDPCRDRAEMERLGLSIGNDFQSILIPRYREAGFVFVTDRPVKFSTTWEKKLRQNQNRMISYLTFLAR